MESKLLNIKDLETTPRTTRKRKFTGLVISSVMDKTIVVRVDRVKTHPKYKKTYLVSKKYKVHDPQNKFKEGDKVEFIECRPISKDKRWRVVYGSPRKQLVVRGS